MTALQVAKQLFDTYDEHCAFPKWVLDPAHFQFLH